MALGFSHASPNPRPGVPPMLTASRFYALPVAHIGVDTEARFFGSIKAADGTFKRTAAGRFAEVDRQLVEQFRVAGARINSVLDIGVSSGITALELFEALVSAGHQAQLTGTDRLVDASILTLYRGCRALVDANGFPLQYDIAGRPVRPWLRRLDFVTGAALARPILDRLLRRRIRQVREQRGHAGHSVKLVTPRLTDADSFEILSDDIMALNPAFLGRFDLVRAANILNRHYFGEARLRIALSHVRRYLRGPGTWLFIVRTHGEDEHHGTLFRMNSAGTLDPIHRFGRGSEVEHLAMSVFGG